MEPKIKEKVWDVRIEEELMKRWSKRRIFMSLRLITQGDHSL